MPRNSSGTYSLYTPGNPVVTNTVISSSWANNTLSDLATAITDSLSRSGDGSMLASLELANGTASLPGLSWGSDLTSGLYRAGASDFRWVNATVELLQLTTNLVQVSGTAPVWRMNESDAAANNKLWDVIVSGEDMHFRVLTDALAATNWLSVTRTAGVVDTVTLAASVTSLTSSFVANTSVALDMSSARPHVRWTETDGAANNQRWLMGPQAEQFIAAVATDNEGTITNWLQVDRTGSTVDTINFPNGTLQYGGIEVGYRGLIFRAMTGNDSTAATDAGKGINYTGAGGHTLTLDADVASTGVVTVINTGTGSFTLSGSGSLSWLNGSGTIPTGNRTVAVGASIFCLSSGSGNWTTWGTGLT
jgi:hypothetical protein